MANKINRNARFSCLCSFVLFKEKRVHSRVYRFSRKYSIDVRGSEKKTYENRDTRGIKKRNSNAIS